MSLGLAIVFGLLLVVAVSVLIIMTQNNSERDKRLDRLEKHLKVDGYTINFGVTKLDKLEIKLNQRIYNLEGRLDNLPQTKHKKVQEESEKVKKMIEDLEE